MSWLLGAERTCRELPTKGQEKFLSDNYLDCGGNGITMNL